MTIITRVLAVLCLLFAFVGESNAAKTEMHYVVQRGDTLTAIAKKFSVVDYRDIASANKIENVDMVYAGSTLLIPVVSNLNTTVALPHVEVAKKTHVGYEVGVASWYGKKYHGKITASGETYDMHAHTVAHPTLPFGTMVRIENTTNGRSVVARVNDRGPFVNGRIVDVSYQIATELKMVRSGTAVVRLNVVENPNTISHVARAVVSQRKDPESTLGIDAMQATHPPLLMSEVVMTSFGPAHVADGLNMSTVSSEVAIAKLFPNADTSVRTQLYVLTELGAGKQIDLLVGDVMQEMIPAEGVVYAHVLQAQISNAPLRAMCYVAYDEKSAHEYLLLQDESSRNWYGEQFSSDHQDADSCFRNRQYKERISHH